MRGSKVALLALLMVKMALGEAEQKSTTTQSTTSKSTTTQSEASGWGSWVSQGVSQGVGFFKHGVETVKNYATGTTAIAEPPGSESKDSKDSDKSLLNRAGCALGRCALTVANAAYQGATEVANDISESEAAKKLGEVKQAIIRELDSRINLEELMKLLENPLVTVALMVLLNRYPVASIAHKFITSEQGKALLGLNKVAEKKKELITKEVKVD